MTEDGRKVVFISGPVTGKDDYYKAFDEAEWELACQGHIVLNPAVLPADLPDAAYMPICIAMLEQSDAVYVLEGWRESAGARTEVAYAERQGKIVIYEEDEKKCRILGARRSKGSFVASIAGIMEIGRTSARIAETCSGSSNRARRPRSWSARR